METQCARKVLGVLTLSCFFSLSFSQTNFTDKIPEWKKLFPKEDVIASSLKEVIDFSLNPNSKPGESKVRASVSNEITLVPVKDYLKYEDGLFYYDQVDIANVKVINSESRDVRIEKNCSSYNEENIFHSDAKLCVVKFPLGERGKPFTFSYKEDYKDIKFLTSFYFNQHLPAAQRIIQFNIPAWMDVDLREFNFEGNAIEKT